MAKKNKVTVDAIANKLGMSRAQVSRALHDYGSVKPETKRLVKETAAALGYNGSVAARGLASGKSFNIGYYFPVNLTYSNMMQSYLYLETFSGIVDEAAKHNYHVTVFNDNEQNSVLKNLRVDGCITTENGLSIIEGLTCDKVVMYAREDRDYEYDNIVISSETAMEQAVDLITTLNRSSIRFLCCEEFNAHSGNNLKLDVYRRLFKKHGIELPESSVIRFKRSFNDMHNAISSIIKNLSGPTVLIALSDAIAFEALRTALDMGVSVPDDLAVLGFDDAPFSSTITPSLTTFAKNRHEMGSMAVKMLLKRINSTSKRPPEREIVRAELVRRESL